MLLLLFTREGCSRCPMLKEMVYEVFSCSMIKEINADNIPLNLMSDLLDNSIFIFSMPTLILKRGEEYELVYCGNDDFAIEDLIEIRNEELG